MSKFDETFAVVIGYIQHSRPVVTGVGWHGLKERGSVLISKDRHAPSARATQRHLAHERKEISVLIAEKSHPQLMVGQHRDEMRDRFEKNAAGRQCFESSLEVGNLVIDD